MRNMFKSKDIRTTPLTDFTAFFRVPVDDFEQGPSSDYWASSTSIELI